MSDSETSDASTPSRRTGYRRSTDVVGVRNRVLVLPSVICSHVVADRIADRLPEAVSAPHDHGCAQLGADTEQTERTLVNVALNPNVAGTVVVGLGCEEVQSGDVAAALDARRTPVREVSIQDAGGTEACLDVGVETAKNLAAADAPDRVPVDLGDLTLGVVGSDLASSTVTTADPLVGELVREVVAGGGRVVTTGVERLVAHPEAARTATADEAQSPMDALLERHCGRPAAVSRVRREAAEQSFEAVTRAWGDLPVQDVLDYGERATHDAGLAVVDAPSEFAQAVTGLAAAGAQLVVHVTEDGVPAGHPLVPVVKVTGNPETAAALSDDIDVNGGKADAADLRRTIEQTAGGEPCRAERHGLTEFAIARVGPSM